MADVITTLHPENDETINLYPNIKKDNIPANAIDTGKLANESVTEAKLANESVTESKLESSIINRILDTVEVKSYHNVYYPVPFNDFDNIKESCFYSWGDSGAISNVANKPSNLDSNAETLF